MGKRNAGSITIVIINQVFKNDINNICSRLYSFKNARFVCSRMVNKSTSFGLLGIGPFQGVARTLPNVAFEDLLIEWLCVFLLLWCYCNTAASGLLKSRSLALLYIPKFHPALRPRKTLDNLVLTWVRVRSLVLIWSVDLAFFMVRHSTNDPNHSFDFEKAHH